MADQFELENAGSKETDIPVSISYRIIELFSAGLYSSPNKAIEELVANSYDALATNVHIILPVDHQSLNAIIWVIDDGMSMDAAGFMDLWRIATSKKRDPGLESKERPPIGKFGIGKLATYVLARQLTYICKRNDEYRAVTMDYTRINPSSGIESETRQLPVRRLTEDQARDLLASIQQRDDEGTKAIPLFGKKASRTWTVAAMANLTGLAQKLTPGRLRWVLSTALPLSPAFNLFFNGERLSSKREKLQPLKSWQIGVDDKVAERLKLQVNETPPSVEIEGLGLVSGTSAIFEDPFTGAKADLWGRSHGLFITVRGRLINIDDPLFGLPALSHGPFSRFRMEVQADGLDSLLRSTREAVMESEGVNKLREYLSDKFNETRTWYNNWLIQEDYNKRLSVRIGATPLSLSRTPLINAIRGVLDGAIPGLSLVRVPQNLDLEQKAALIERLQADLISDEGIIKEVRFEPLGLDAFLALLDAETGCVSVNMLHPFYANYIEHFQNPEPFELLAVAEILTEAYLLEEGLSPEATRSILQRRDRFLRELIFSRQMAAPLVAEYLRSCAADSTGLEKAVAEALRSLGFEVSPIGGKNEPDGVALARLGVRNEATGSRSDYRITYDAKSTGKARVQAHTVGSGTIYRHRDKYGAQYSLVVAVDFAAADSEDGAIVIEAEQQGITLITIEDLARLVLLAATRQLGFTQLRELFETCRRPANATAWINNILNQEAPAGPLPQILDAIWELTEESPDPVKFAAVALKLRTNNKAKIKLREKEIREWMESLRRLAGGYVTIDGDVVSLEAPPEKILREVRVVSHRLPEQFQQQLMIESLLSKSETI